MGVFNSTRTVPYTSDDYAATAEAVMADFRSKGFEATGDAIPTGGHYLSLTKGDTFQAYLGLKSALNVRIEPDPGGTKITAEIGEYGKAFVGALGSFIFWPLAIPGLIGAVRSSQLDEQAITAVETELKLNGEAAAPGAPAAAAPAAETAPAAATCSACGAALPDGAKFCQECGTKVEA